MPNEQNLEKFHGSNIRFLSNFHHMILSLKYEKPENQSDLNLFLKNLF